MWGTFFVKQSDSAIGGIPCWTSVIEEDYIDRMLPGGKRDNFEIDEQTRPKKRRKGGQSTFKGQSAYRKRQQKLTGLLSRAETTISTDHAWKRSHTLSRGNKGRGLTLHQPRPSTPPRLSILDVAEPNAPVVLGQVGLQNAQASCSESGCSFSARGVALSDADAGLMAIITPTAPGSGCLSALT